jgi:gamma-glutamylaminecyclotransferase
MRATEPDDCELLFVYGTLKRRHPNHAQLAGARFLGEARTASGYALYRAGPYPALTLGGAARVHGELYAVTREHFRRLDEFEGCPWLYERGRVQLADGRWVAAYLIPETRQAECDECLGESWP